MEYARFLKMNMGNVAPAARNIITLVATVALRKNACIYCKPPSLSPNDCMNIINEKTVL